MYFHFTYSKGQNPYNGCRYSIISPPVTSPSSSTTTPEHSLCWLRWHRLASLLKFIPISHSLTLNFSSSSSLCLECTIRDIHLPTHSFQIFAHISSSQRGLLQPTGVILQPTHDTQPNNPCRLPCAAISFITF